MRVGKTCVARFVVASATSFVVSVGDDLLCTRVECRGAILCAGSLVPAIFDEHPPCDRGVQDMLLVERRIDRYPQPATGARVSSALRTFGLLKARDSFCPASVSPPHLVAHHIWLGSQEGLGRDTCLMSVSMDFPHSITPCMTGKLGFAKLILSGFHSHRQIEAARKRSAGTRSGSYLHNGRHEKELAMEPCTSRSRQRSRSRPDFRCHEERGPQSHLRSMPRRRCP